jgi:hypothetical protein
VCGPEPVLVRDVVAAHREGAAADQCVALFAGDVPEQDIWNHLLSVPPGGGRRAVVYGAEKLKNTSDMDLLTGEEALATAYVVFVSGDGDFAQEDGALAPHLVTLKSAKSGQMIRCCEPSKLEDRVALVASWWPGASAGFAHDVLARCGSLERAWQACEQARLAGLKPVAPSAAVTCPAEPGGELADHLMAGSRRAAMAAAGRVGPGELGAVIGLLTVRLAAVEQVGAGLRAGLSLHEAVAGQDVSRFVASQVARYARSYDADRVRRCRQRLAQADSAWRSGARDGVAESLVAGW